MNARAMLTVLISTTICASTAWAQDQVNTSASDMSNMPAMDHGSMDNDAMPGMAGTMPDGKSGDMLGINDKQKGGDAPAPKHDMDSMSMHDGTAATGLRDSNAYSDGYTLDSGAYALPGSRQLRLADEHHFGSLLLNRMERLYTSDSNSTAFDAQAWFGRDYDRLVVKAEGDVAQGKLQDVRTELLWGHAISSFWDMQVGARHDGGIEPDRNWLAFGIQGLAPYWFELEATAYAGDNGKSALRLGAEYEFLLTQKLILQPRAEINLYGKSDSARDIGSGLSDGLAGLRLRYEFTRQFAPYAGIEWAGKFGQTADFARAASAKSSEKHLVAGVRFWF